jgi:hypothetical protein
LRSLAKVGKKKNVLERNHVYSLQGLHKTSL